MGSGQETVLCYVAGAAFAIGWWIWIDATVYSVSIDDDPSHIGYYFIPGIVSTIAVLMINAVSWNDLNNNFLFGDGVSTKARVWILFSFIVAFGGIAAAIWGAIAHWFQASPKSEWGGVALIIQNVLIFASAMIVRFAKPSEDTI